MALQCFGVLGSPLSPLAATPSPWGFLPLPEERRDGGKCGMLGCVLGCQPHHCQGTGIWGTKVCCATPAPAVAGEGGGSPPGGGLGSISEVWGVLSVLRVSVLRGL